MTFEFKTNILRVIRNEDKIVYESVISSELKSFEDGCQVGGCSDDPDNPYCIDN